MATGNDFPKFNINENNFYKKHPDTYAELKKKTNNTNNEDGIPYTDIYYNDGPLSYNWNTYKEMFQTKEVAKYEKRKEEERINKRRKEYEEAKKMSEKFIEELNNKIKELFKEEKEIEINNKKYRIKINTEDLEKKTEFLIGNDNISLNDILDQLEDMVNVDDIPKLFKGGKRRKTRRNRKSKKGKRSRKVRKSRRKSNRRRGRR